MNLCPPALILANVVTSSRLILLPFFVVNQLAGEKSYAFILIVMIGLTDVLDGLIARLYTGPQKHLFGAIFDLSADFIVIVVIFSTFVYMKLVPSLVICLLGLSFFLFSLLSFLRKEAVKNFFGRFIGTACYLYIVFFLASEIWFNSYLSVFFQFGPAAIILYLLLTSGETAVLIINFFVRRRR